MTQVTLPSNVGKIKNSAVAKQRIKANIWKRKQINESSYTGLGFVMCVTALIFAMQMLQN